ncbi:MAG: hypothetical protein NVV60_08420 [Luteimonas sp.]|nr:hypothetical protein [Luteimonas sp.]
MHNETTTMRICTLLLACIACNFPGMSAAADGNTPPDTAATAIPVALLAMQGQSSPQVCPNPGMMDRLCSYIRNREKDNVPDSIYAYRYQRIVYEASCVDFINDTDDKIVQKVNAMWEIHGAHLRCGPMGNPATGSPLRYAMHTFFNDFMSEAFTMWKLDYNKVEDGETLLDYVERRVTETTATIQRDFINYRRILVSVGAKRASEL